MEKETSRVEAFSDGVFAIALTLLILGIKIPNYEANTSNEILFRSLVKLWPSFLAFLLSFTTILIMWINHHGFFKYLRKINSAFLYANGFLLLMITFINFPTVILAEYFESPALNTASAFYCGTMVIINIAFNLMWFTSAYKRKLIKYEITDALIIKIRNVYLLSFVIYITAFIVSFFFPLIGLLICISLWILWLVLDYDKQNEKN
ncbi:MAG: TMEM175 family protein [Bacteroidota bacterium]